MTQVVVLQPLGHKLVQPKLFIAPFAGVLIVEVQVSHWAPCHSGASKTYIFFGSKPCRSWPPAIPMELPVTPNFGECEFQALRSYGATSKSSIRRPQCPSTNTNRRVQTIKAGIDAPNQPAPNCVKCSVLPEFVVGDGEHHNS